MIPLLGPLLDFLLPAACPACTVNIGPALCASCRHRLEAIDHPCPACGAPRRGPTAACAACRGQGLAFLGSVQVLWHYHGLMERLIHEAKVSGCPASSSALAGCLPRPDPRPDAVVPIPPVPGRRHGPHLATRLAAAAARACGAPLRRILHLKRIPAEQHRLGAAQRRANVEDIFVCRVVVPPAILIVDDILTTGATAVAAARELHRMGARQLRLLCLARTPRQEDLPRADD